MRIDVFVFAEHFPDAFAPCCCPSTLRPPPGSAPALLADLAGRRGAVGRALQATREDSRPARLRLLGAAGELEPARHRQDLRALDRQLAERALARGGRGSAAPDAVPA